MNNSTMAMPMWTILIKKETFLTITVSRREHQHAGVDTIKIIQVITKIIIIIQITRVIKKRI